MGTAANTAATHFAGIDVSKDTLDAGLLGPDARSRATTRVILGPHRVHAGGDGIAPLPGWSPALRLPNAPLTRPGAEGPGPS